MTLEDIEALEKLNAERTRGVWRVDEEGFGCYVRAPGEASLEIGHHGEAVLYPARPAEC